MSNYLRKLMREAARGGFKKGEVSSVMFRHDEWCDFLNDRGECNCNPEMEVKVLPASDRDQGLEILQKHMREVDRWRSGRKADER